MITSYTSIALIATSWVSLITSFQPPLLPAYSVCRTKPVLLRGRASSHPVIECVLSTGDVMCTLDWHVGALLCVNSTECA